MVDWPHLAGGRSCCRAFAFSGTGHVVLPPLEKGVIYMTQQNRVESGRQADAGAITPEMVAAGVTALAAHLPLDEVWPVGGAEDAVEAVLRAALSLSIPHPIRGGRPSHNGQSKAL